MLGYQGAANFSTTPVVLNSSTATLVAAANPSRRRAIIQNISGSIISWFGPDDTVVANDGLRIAVNSEEPLETTAAIYGISASGTPARGEEGCCVRLM